jgi:hypothetical protein
MFFCQILTFMFCCPAAPGWGLGGATSMNPVAGKLTGWSLAEVHGHSFYITRTHLIQMHRAKVVSKINKEVSFNAIKDWSHNTFNHDGWIIGNMSDCFFLTQ